MAKPSNLVKYADHGVKIIYGTGKIAKSFPVQINTEIQKIGLDSFIRKYIDNSYLKESDILELFGDTIYQRFLVLNLSNLKLEKQTNFLEDLDQKLQTNTISKFEYEAQKAEYLALISENYATNEF